MKTTRKALLDLAKAVDDLLSGGGPDEWKVNIEAIHKALTEADKTLDTIPDVPLQVISDADTGTFLAAFADEDLARWFVDESGQVAVNVRTVEVEP